jgi:hypothetical protein
VTSSSIAFSNSWEEICTPRTGVAQFTRLAFQGADLRPAWNALMETVTDDVPGSGMGMDLSVIAQLLGDKDTGLAIQRDTLKIQQLYRLNPEQGVSRLRVLAIAAASDIGANTPIEFLVEGSGVHLATYYVVPGAALPNPMPEHDVAIVVAPATADGKDALDAVDAMADAWPRPILNRPGDIRNLERDRLFHRLQGIEGLVIPATERARRRDLAAVAARELALTSVLADGAFPIIIRPPGSHAGFGLAKIDDADGLRDYLSERPEEELFVSHYIDYASEDGRFRKFRLVVIDGKAFACHMAIADEWKVWYLNGDMAASIPNRIEEAAFMQFFDGEFASRHRGALTAMARAIGLDYFIVDCAETREGDLLIFEADNAAIVHDMDPPSVYPYKSAQMQKIFSAFVEMLCRRSRKSCAA